MDNLFLEDLAHMNSDEVLKHITNEYECDTVCIKKQYDILIAYESVGDYGCDSSSYFLLKDKDNNKYFEVNGSHC